LASKDKDGQPSRDVFAVTGRTNLIEGPRRGQSGRQEFYAGHAEDHFRVLSLSADVRTPAVSLDAALLTREWTPLEPRVVDHKV
jgi:hypothetical protein